MKGYGQAAGYSIRQSRLYDTPVAYAGGRRGYGSFEQSYLCEKRARILRRRQKRRREAQVRVYRMVVRLLAILLLVIVLAGFSRATAAKAPSHKYYTAVTVRGGDTLWGLAQEYITEEYASMKEYIREIQKINGITGDSIYYGQKLILPYYARER